MDTINLALIGYGTIGKGVATLLETNGKVLEEKTGISLSLKYVIDKDLEKLKPLKEKGIICSDNFMDALNDKEVDIVIELAGGVDFPFLLFQKAMEKEKHFVTANKALLAKKLFEMFQTAKEKQLHIGFEASVAGGIPIIQTLRNSLVGNKIQSIEGIINGTTNYILTQMQEEDLPFSEALEKAQELGFAEADPTLDINGGDAAAKIAVLASIAFKKNINLDDVPVKGIEDVRLSDIQSAEEMGFKIKLIAHCAQDEQGKIDLSVGPSLIAEENPLSGIRNEFNAVLVNSDFLGESMYYGKGAGSFPTASAIASDIADIAVKITKKKVYNPSSYTICDEKSLKPLHEKQARYFIRIMTEDKPGILAKLASVLGENEISIASLMQRRSDEKLTPVILTTHEAREDQFWEAFGKLKKLDITQELVYYRILE